MKQLKCEMCGSTDLVKQDGMFVCQICGTRYSVEDAKKMMIEGTVDVQGTVKVDNSSFVEKYLLNARRALDKTDWEEVEKYYNLVEQNDPKNIEAIFFSSYGKAMLSLTDSDRFKRQQKFDVFKKSISVIDDYYDVSKKETLKPIIQKMSEYLVKMTQNSFVYKTSEYGNDSVYTYTMFAHVETQFIESIENIIAKDEQVYLYKILLNHYSRCIQNPRVSAVDASLYEKYQQKMKEVNAKLKQIDPNFQETPIPKAKIGGCYVATCVYGSYDCPEVWTLRRYRDNVLGSTRRGRAFIKCYYAVSPTLVRWFGHTNWFKKMWRGKLDKMVRNLQEQGLEDTPYKDIDWRENARLSKKKK